MRSMGLALLFACTVPASAAFASTPVPTPNASAIQSLNKQMTVMLQSGLDISPVITHRLPYSEFAEGFAIAGSGRSGKVVLDWTEG